MKNYLSRLLLKIGTFIIVLSTSAVFAENTEPCSCSDGKLEFVAYPKTYINPRQIDFFENLIFIKLSDELILQTEAIHSDAHGLYITSVGKNDCSWAEWKCPRCHACNLKIRSVCSRCKYYRG